MILCAPILWYLSGQILNERITEMSETLHPEDNTVSELTSNSSMSNGLVYLGEKSVMESAPAYSGKVCVVQK